MEPSRADFWHPYKPYEIQLRFMENLYHCIESGNVAIFESPTGTGKSLSLICASLTWLRDHKRRLLEGNPNTGKIEEDPAWMVEADIRERRNQLIRQREDLERRLLTIRAGNSDQAILPRNSSLKVKRKRSNNKPTSESQNISENCFELEDYESEEEGTEKYKNSLGGNISADTQALLEKLRRTSTGGEGIEFDETKVIFCSRTHSQLTQFVGELRRVQLPPSFVTRDLPHVQETVKHISLGSRKSLCIYEQVSQLRTTSAINERCLELQKPGIVKDLRCPFTLSKGDQTALESFQDLALGRIRDIEELANLGRDHGVCPYYASRAAIAPCEIVTLPYPLLLQRSAREALGLSVKGHVIIIDEAHNLSDAIADVFSVTITSCQLEKAVTRIVTYAQKFKNRLKGKNRVYVTQIIRLLQAIADCFRRTASENSYDDISLSPEQLMRGKGVDQIKPHKLIRYLRESKLVNKVDGYMESHETNEPCQQGVLSSLQSFLIVLMNPADEGRFFFSKKDQDFSIRYVLLDPREHFRDIVEDSRAVILAGGTMSPMSDYGDYLFSYVDAGRLKTFSCGHVIPKENLFAQVITRGPTGVEFDLTFQNRQSEDMILDLGQIVEKVCCIVPDGVVAFFPSYDYLAIVMRTWRHNPAGVSVLAAIEMRKQVFEEPRPGEESVESLLRKYAEAVDTGRGALLLSVVGGKLSEGINFSDRLGRAVLAVGLPFPNIYSAEWKAKIEHVEQITRKKLDQNSLSEEELRSQTKEAGREFYENACMRAVNQCIGRAIRHMNDYAAILLVDRRYSTRRIRKKLPGWITESMGLTTPTRIGQLEAGLKSFFGGKA